MPQRARLDNKEDVHAFDMDDPAWYGLGEAYHAGRLKFPCCGVKAIPKDSEGMIRHFAHPPNTLDKCEAKKTGEFHDQIIAAVAKVAIGLGWSVKSEYELNGFVCDVVCMREASDLSIGFEFETAKRNNEALIQLNQGLLNNGLTQVHWFFKKGRHGGIPDFAFTYQFQASEKEGLLQQIRSSCRKVLGDIEKTIQNTKSVIKGLKDNNVPYELEVDNKIPKRLVIFPKDQESKHILDLGPHLNLKSPYISETPSNLERGERLAKVQESLVQIVRKNLADGDALWWDGHPELLKHSFQRLRHHVQRLEQKRARQIHWAQQQAEHTEPQRPIHKGIHQGIIRQPFEPSEDDLFWRQLKKENVERLLKDLYPDEKLSELFQMRFDQLDKFSLSEAINMNKYTFQIIEVAVKSAHSK